LSLWRDRSVVREPESPQSLASAAAFERKRPPNPEGHTVSLDEQASQRFTAEEETTKNANDTFTPTDLHLHRSPTPPLSPPKPKVKVSFKDYATRKRKQWAEEMANQVASSVSPGSTTSALEPAVSVGGGAAAESASPRVNGMEMEMDGVESREIASENREADTMAVDTPAEEDTSSFPNGVVDDGGDSEEPIIRIEGSPTHMRSPSSSRSSSPKKDMRPPSHTSKGTDFLKS